MESGEKSAYGKEEIPERESELWQYLRRSSIALVRFADAALDCTSMEYVAKNVLILFFASLSIMLIFILFLLLSGAYFIRSIINPVQNIIKSANEIARGNWSVHIEKQHDDEIGLLADTMNAMAKDLQQADELKNEFISSVSHELRTPLTSIKGWSETALMTDENDKESIRKCLAVIAKESERLNKMVEQMLNFPKTKNAKMSLNLQEMDLQGELDDIVFIFVEQLKQNSLKIQYHIDEELPPILGDKDKLKQVFINILDNAAKFSEHAALDCIASSHTKTALTITVTDQGCGIPAQELPRIKDKFYKGISQKHGSGLGLAITDEIVTAHGGTLDIESEYGKGTKVSVTLPLRR